MWWQLNTSSLSSSFYVKQPGFAESRNYPLASSLRILSNSEFRLSFPLILSSIREAHSSDMKMMTTTTTTTTKAVAPSIHIRYFQAEHTWLKLGVSTSRVPYHTSLPPMRKSAQVTTLIERCVPLKPTLAFWLFFLCSRKWHNAVDCLTHQSQQMPFSLIEFHTAPQKKTPF